MKGRNHIDQFKIPIYFFNEQCLFPPPQKKIIICWSTYLDLNVNSITHHAKFGLITTQLAIVLIMMNILWLYYDGVLTWFPGWLSGWVGLMWNQGYTKASYWDSPLKMIRTHANICLNLHGVDVSLVLVGFNFGLKQRCGLFTTVWDSSLRIIRRHAITILNSLGGDDSTLIPPDV